MKKSQCALLLILLSMCTYIQAQETESEDYIEFNDSKNVVHGVYLGLTFNYGEIDHKSTYMAGAKIAYVANKKLEVGFTGVGFYLEDTLTQSPNGIDVFGAYGGLHLEPILFGNSAVSVSFPMLIGAGAASYSLSDFEYYYSEKWDHFFVFEPGLSILYNVSSYLQFEMGVKYRLTSDFELYPNSIENLQGFSGGIGLKIGVFNLGKKR